MGLDIHGKKTGHHLGGGYSRLHFGARFLALIACGMPVEDINIPDYMNNRQPIMMYMASSGSTLSSFINAVQLSGFYCPNLMLHSDCEGKYTKNGKPAPITKEWLGGNSIKLLEELESILKAPDVIKLKESNEQVQRAIEYTIKLRDLVKDEIENGCGTITFG